MQLLNDPLIEESLFYGNHRDLLGILVYSIAEFTTPILQGQRQATSNESNVPGFVCLLIIKIKWHYVASTLPIKMKTNKVSFNI